MFRKSPHGEIDAHELKIQGTRRNSSDFCQNYSGGQGSLSKIARGIAYFGFYCIFMNKSFEICLGGPVFTPPPLSPLSPMFASMHGDNYPKLVNTLLRFYLDLRR
jgi:hypothetical protein